MNTPTSRASGGAADVAAAAGAALLFAAAAVVGAAAYDGDVLFLAWPPLFADWRPHAGPGTPAALIAAGLVVGFGPAAARRLPWRWLLASAWAGSMAWVWSLALVDGWERGVARRLAYGHEYLTVVGEVDGVGAFLRGFSGRIPLEAQDAWPAHVAGHPPGATLTFVLLDRVGLGGGAWAGAFCVTASASAAAAVLITVRALAGEGAGRRAAPFLVLFPGAVWMGVSADGWFAAVAAWAVALLALSATRDVRSWWAAAAGSGLLWGLLLYLSYGLVLMAPVGVAVLWRARNARPLPWVLAGALPCVAAFTAGGFWWFEGYFTLVDRYHAGAGGYRPYAYFVWANLAAQVASVGLATAAGLRRAGARPRAAAGLVTLVAAGAAAMLAADLSGMSKAETERIWLPFALWLTPACALLPETRARRWLALQAALALAVNHLWLTRW